jgi:hypothetical protein
VKKYRELKGIKTRRSIEDIQREMDRNYLDHRPTISHSLDVFHPLKIFQ